MCSKMVRKRLQLPFPRQFDRACVASGRRTGHQGDGNLAEYQTYSGFWQMSVGTERAQEEMLEQEERARQETDLQGIKSNTIRLA